MSNIKEYKSYYRTNKVVKFNRERLGYMTLHAATDLPIARYGRGLSKEQRNRPIELTNILRHNDQEVKQSLCVSYNSVKGAPSYRIYDILMALYWLFQEQGYNHNKIEARGISCITNKIGGNPRTIISDLRKLQGVTISGENILFDIQDKAYYDIDIQPFPHFIRRKTNPENKIPSWFVFGVDEYFMKYIQNNLLYQPESYHDFFQLGSVLAKLLFLRLMKEFRTLHQDGKEILKKDIKRLGDWLLLENKSVHSMRQTFEHAGAELKNIGFLLYEPTIKVNKQRTGYNIIFKASPKLEQDRYWIQPPQEEERYMVASMDTDCVDYG